MANIRIKDLANTASSTASDDFIAVDGATNGTRKLNAYSPSFGGNATVAGTLTVSAGSLVVDHVGSSSPTLSLSANGSVQSRFFANGSNTFLESYTSTPLILRTNQTTALTITTGQQVQVNATTASTSTSTGALVVSGGLGVAGAINAGGNVGVASGNSLRLYNSVNSGYISIYNFNERLNVNYPTSLIDTTASTSTSTGALVVSGGVGVAGAAYIGGKVSINGASVSASQFAIASASGTLIANLTAGSTTDQSFGLRIFAGTTASDYGLLIRNVGDTTQLFKVDGVGGTTVGGSVTTAAPAGGTAAAWKLGTVATVSPTSPNRTIEVDIGGTIYYIHAKTTNN